MNIEETIKKLLALAASPNANEAIAAMNKARELMARFSISISDDPKEIEIISRDYNIPFRVPSFALKYMPNIVDIISENFGVICSVNPIGCQIIQNGFRKNIEIAAYACDIILNQCNADYRAKYRQVRSISFGESFWSGVSIAIYERFSMTKEQTEGLVVYNPVRSYVDAETIGRFDPSFNASNANALSAGIESGKNAKLYKGVSSSGAGKLLS